MPYNWTKINKMIQQVDVVNRLEEELIIAKKAVKHLATRNQALSIEVVKLKKDRVEHLTIRQVERVREWSVKVLKEVSR